MARNNNIKLSKFELEIMDALWELGQASVREVREKLPERKQPAYTTVQTMIYRLEEKGAVQRVKKIGNAHIFAPTVTRQGTHKRLIKEFLEMLGGTRPLMAHLVKAGQLSLEDIRELESTLAQQEEEI